jgi:hypothetical protein
LSRVRSEMIARSNCANDRNTLNINRPIEVLLTPRPASGTTKTLWIKANNAKRPMAELWASGVNW